MTHFFLSNLTRRTFMTGLASGAAMLGLSGLAQALTPATAKALVNQVVDDINTTISSGRSESVMLQEFERIFERYADVQTIALSALGPDRRRASQAQLRQYVDAFSYYLSRKYGRRFREFIGGRIEVQEARAVRSFYEVQTTAILRGQAPFSVVFLVSDRSGRDLFFNIFIEGVNMLASERTEIGAMLDRRRGNIDALIQDLRRT
ncbi:MlaC/ttg2D family ABC transporter substrate-binding protein [Pseudaestuariivita rosea]|uniref:MlaC/ttg2D family ABC transporter substrate-binding protein n=1 Tax=Pseudaestuariivita rosea TaxID=2763263 RepID=UPI001ABAEFB7|nr:ABC transporter substrate-binding protein [Pseudaestuariivita rosea]